MLHIQYGEMENAAYGPVWFNSKRGQPEAFIESSEYLSWERYFTDYLEKKTAGDSLKAYQKSHLSHWYTEGQNKERIKQVCPAEFRVIIDKIADAHKTITEASDHGHNIQ